MPKTDNQKEATVYPIEQIQQLGHVSDSIHAGTCALMGWGKGKEVTIAEYTAATVQFQGAAGERSKHA